MTQTPVTPAAELMDRAVTPISCTRQAPVRVVLGNGEVLTGTLKSFGWQRLSLITNPPTGESGFRSLVVSSLQGVFQHRHQMLVPTGLPARSTDMQTPVRVPVVNGIVELYQWIDAEGRESDGAYLDYDYVKGKAAELGGEVKCLRFEYADSETLDDFREKVTG